MHRVSLLFWGVAFGFILSRVGATDFDAILGMFALTDLHLAGVIGVAVAVAAPALWWLRRRGIAGPAGPIVIAPKPRKPGNVVGAVLFGAGWAITGTCPGTVLAQVGEGRLVALFTLSGVLLGVAIHRRFGATVERRLSRLRSTTLGASRPGAREGNAGTPGARHVGPQATAT